MPQRVSAFGWPNTIRLANSRVELLTATDVGPRVLSFRLLKGNDQNVLRIYPDQMGKSWEPEYQVRGGHRLWVSPETEMTYAPDNGPAQVHAVCPGRVRITQVPSPEAPLQKDLTLCLQPESCRVRLEHRIMNVGPSLMKIASWGLTVMAPGGWHIIPQPPLGSHDTDLLPQRVIVPWSYTHFGDPRWRFGRRYWQLHPSPDGPPTKIGFALPSGWVAYVLPGLVFFKHFFREPLVEYPDLGCNYETFCKGDFVELETLSPIVELDPGESIGHTEEWFLFESDTPPPGALDDAQLDAWLRPLIAQFGSNE